MSDIVRFHRDNLLKRLHDRARITALLREFFTHNGFLEVETPILCSSPGVECHLAAFDLFVGSSKKYLSTSPEYHMKRLLAVGLERIFQVTRAFRAGEMGRRHNPEFTIVEWYRIGVGYEAIMEDCEALLAYLCRGLHGTTKLPEVFGMRRDFDFTPPYRRTSFFQAFEEAGYSPHLPLDERFLVLSEHIEPNLGSSGPEFLYDYPADQASLARLKPTNPNVAERFELYVTGIELANGFTEITDPDDFIARCEHESAERRRLNLPQYPIDERYVAMLKNGLPPCAGVALGLDRLVMVLTGAKKIQEVMAFPIDIA